MKLISLVLFLSVVQVQGAETETGPKTSDSIPVNPPVSAVQAVMQDTQVDLTPFQNITIAEAVVRFNYLLRANAKGRPVPVVMFYLEGLSEKQIKMVLNRKVAFPKKTEFTCPACEAIIYISQNSYCLEDRQGSTIWLVSCSFLKTKGRLIEMPKYPE